MVYNYFNLLNSLKLLKFINNNKFLWRYAKTYSFKVDIEFSYNMCVKFQLKEIYL